jgi:hypothetical protein
VQVKFQAFGFVQAPLSVKATNGMKQLAISEKKDAKEAGSRPGNVHGRADTRESNGTHGCHNTREAELAQLNEFSDYVAAEVFSCDGIKRCLLTAAPASRSRATQSMVPSSVNADTRKNAM